MDETALKTRHARSIASQADSNLLKLPRELLIVILSMIDRATALAARLVCIHFERCLYHAAITVDLREDFDVQEIMRFLILFPKIKTFRLPPVLKSAIDWKRLESREAGAVPLDWSLVEISECRRQFQAWEAAGAWSYVLSAVNRMIPTNFDLSNNMDAKWKGYALQRLGRDAEALVVYEMIIKNAPDDHIAMSHCFSLYRKLGRLKESLSMAQRAVQLATASGDDTSTYYHNLALTQARLSMYPEALESIAHIHSSLPRPTLLLKADIFISLSRYSESIEILDQLLETDPKDAKVANDAAYANLELSRFDRAIELFDRAIKIDPKDATVVYNRALALFEMERVAEALEGFDRALELQPDDPASLSRRAKCLITLGGEQRIDRAQKDFARVLDLTQALADSLGEFDSSWNARGHAMLFFNRPREAYDCFNRVLASKSDAELLFNRASALLARGVLEEALLDITKAVSMKPLPAYVKMKKLIEEKLAQTER